jgi:hypothetical protein
MGHWPIHPSRLAEAGERLPSERKCVRPGMKG